MPENEVLSWDPEWATLWTAKGDNARRLTTPVDVVPISNGAELVFVDKRAPKRSKAGGVRLVVEAMDGGVRAVARRVQRGHRRQGHVRGPDPGAARRVATFGG